MQDRERHWENSIKHSFYHLQLDESSSTKIHKIMITTYMSDYELNLYTSVKDDGLNELFQEVRSKFVNRYFLREREIRVKKIFFRREITKTLYSVYVLHSNGEVQCINFCREWDWSINTDVPKSYIYAYFYGLLTGVDYSQKYIRR